MDAHRLAELRSIAFHGAVGERLRADEALLQRARERVEDWLATGRVHHEYARAWRQLLARPVPEICEAIVADDDHMRTLRSVTPFAGAIDPRTRWQIWRATREVA